jgi:hypothetical protein
LGTAGIVKLTPEFLKLDSEKKFDLHLFYSLENKILTKKIVKEFGNSRNSQTNPRNFEA